MNSQDICKVIYSKCIGPQNLNDNNLSYFVPHSNNLIHVKTYTNTLKSTNSQKIKINLYDTNTPNEIPKLSQEFDLFFKHFFTNIPVKTINNIRLTIGGSTVDRVYYDIYEYYDLIASKINLEIMTERDSMFPVPILALNNGIPFALDHTIEIEINLNQNDTFTDDIVYSYDIYKHIPNEHLKTSLDDRDKKEMIIYQTQHDYFIDTGKIYRLNLNHPVQYMIVTHELEKDMNFLHLHIVDRYGEKYHIIINKEPHPNYKKRKNYSVFDLHYPINFSGCDRIHIVNDENIHIYDVYTFTYQFGIFTNGLFGLKYAK
jgi:hypothetical protein